VAEASEGTASLARKKRKRLSARERQLEQLRVELRYHRERRDLYHAKVHGRRPTSLARLEELRRACDLAESRIRRLEQGGEAD
jgi:hypothetical protein